MAKRMIGCVAVAAACAILTGCGGPEDAAPDSLEPDVAGSSSSLLDACAASAANFAPRLALPQSSLSESSWYTASLKDSWGPLAAVLPAASVPTGCDAARRKRDRVVAAAKNYIGLPYQHHHIPAWNPRSAWPGEEGPGLDCSNFTSWVYNFGLGVKFTSNVRSQADGASAPGRRLGASEALAPGDLLFILNSSRTAIGHVVLYVDPYHIIDATSGLTVQVRSFSGWYKTRD